jgi:ABC-type branched-subunit amino acid transport system ATPase component
VEGLAPVIVELLLLAFEQLVRDESSALVLVEHLARMALRIT